MTWKMCDKKCDCRTICSKAKGHGGFCKCQGCIREEGEKEENKRRIGEIKERIKVIELVQKPLWEERHSLDKEVETLYNIEAIELIKRLKWILEYRVKEFSEIMLTCHRDMEKMADKELWKLGGDYHSTFTLHDGVRLHQSDGEVYIIFDSINLYKKYVEEWKLEVDKSRFLEKLSKYKEDIKTFEEMCLE